MFQFSFTLVYSNLFIIVSFYTYLKIYFKKYHNPYTFYTGHKVFDLLITILIVVVFNYLKN